jgi:integrase
MAFMGVDQDGYIFPGAKEAEGLPNATMYEQLHRMGRDEYTVHGFRSSFRDWVSEETGFAGELAEMQLAHEVGDAVEQAYRRGDMLERRRPLMEAWEEYLSRDPVAA